MIDRLTKEQRTKNMRAVKSTGSKIETTLIKALWGRYYRFAKNDRSVFGKPDIVFKKIKVAVFIDSEFWHGKNWKTKKLEHKSNLDFWYKKIERNIERDKEVNKFLKRNGWTVLRFWDKLIEKENQSESIDYAT